MKFVLAVVTISTAVAVLEENCHSLFQEFKLKFARIYENDQVESYRRGIFCASMRRADEKNRINGHESFGVTKFSDRTFEEFSILLGRKDKGVPPSSNSVRKPTQNLLDSSSAIDWASLGKVTPVKNQVCIFISSTFHILIIIWVLKGQCGSCWAFSVAEQVESAWAMAGNALWEFSPQQIASCTKNCFGCGGGDTPAAYDYINSTVGLGSVSSNLTV